MSRPNIFEPDEAVLKEMMQGDVPRAPRDDKSSKGVSDPAPVEEETEHVWPVPEESNNLPAKPSGRRRRYNTTDYEGTFLVNTPSRYRRTAHIESDLYDKVKYYLSIISPD